jgi:hypothetical protein
MAFQLARVLLVLAVCGAGLAQQGYCDQKYNKLTSFTGEVQTSVVLSTILNNYDASTRPNLEFNIPVAVFVEVSIDGCLFYLLFYIDI